MLWSRIAASCSLIEFSLKGIPVVNAAMEARLEAAARVQRKDRHYPLMIEAPDA